MNSPERITTPNEHLHLRNALHHLHQASAAAAASGFRALASNIRLCLHVAEATQIQRLHQVSPPLSEVEALLHLSTIHLSPETRNDWLQNAPITVFGNSDRGWFVHAARDLPLDLPFDLFSAIDLGRELGCAWIRFDQDGPESELLRRYAT